MRQCNECIFIGCLMFVCLLPNETMGASPCLPPGSCSVIMSVLAVAWPLVREDTVLQYWTHNSVDCLNEVHIVPYIILKNGIWKFNSVWSKTRNDLGARAARSSRFYHSILGTIVRKVVAHFAQSVCLMLKGLAAAAVSACGSWVWPLCVLLALVGLCKMR